MISRSREVARLPAAVLAVVRSTRPCVQRIYGSQTSTCVYCRRLWSHAGSGHGDTIGREPQAAGVAAQWDSRGRL